MAYFPNGTAGMAYQERYCFRCKNHQDKGDGRGPGCAVWDAHLVFPSHETVDGKCGPSRESKVLDVLIPNTEDGLSAAECAMFVGDGKDHDALSLFEDGVSGD